MNAAQDASQHRNSIFKDAGFFTFAAIQDGTYFERPGPPFDASGFKVGLVSSLAGPAGATFSLPAFGVAPGPS